MTLTHWKRFGWMSFILGAMTIAVLLVLFALRQNMHLYYTPSQVKAGEAPLGKIFRIGGVVVKNSVHREPGLLKLHFRVTDLQQEVPVVYEGILPDLFREEQGVIVTGQLTSSGFIEAREILAKHDENYMPPELAK